MGLRGRVEQTLGTSTKVLGPPARKEPVPRERFEGPNPSSPTTYSGGGTSGNLSGLSVSFCRYLILEQRKPSTVKTYRNAIRSLIQCIGDKEVIAVTKDDLREFLTIRREQVSLATVSIEFRGLSVFFRWLFNEGETPTCTIDRVKQPRVPEVPPPVFTNGEIKQLLEACKSARSKFVRVRDEAIILTLTDCGMRRSELIGMTVNDLDLDRQLIFLRTTKSGNPRLIPVGLRASVALDRYLRMRSRHILAYRQEFWLGQMGPLSDNGLFQTLRERGKAAGVANVRPHRFRHTWAHQSALAGMQTVDLMTIAGWQSVSMVARYGKSGATERAIAAHRRFSPIDNLD